MVTLSLNGKIFSIDELKNISIDGSATEFEKSTLRFCQSWLLGQKEFAINTSGSTGPPKEIILTREAMEQSARMTIAALKLKSRGTSLVCLDTKYIAGQMMLVRSLINDMNMIAVEPTANPIADLAQQIDFTALVPYQLEHVLDQSSEKMNQVRCAIIGGASISHALREKTKKSTCAIFATYGMTETISHVALQKINGIDAQDHFEALRGIQLRLDNRGCLCIRANHLGEEIITNDLVEMIGDKKFKWLGRIDNVINSGGLKIIPEKVEAVLERVFQKLNVSNRFFVAGMPDEKFGQRVVVVCEGPALDQKIQSTALENVNRLLSKYETPKEFLFISTFAETANGKINRAATLN